MVILQPKIDKLEKDLRPQDYETKNITMDLDPLTP
jgi:hypothetical protein